ncbi:MAG: zinc dependent phospholipase C family protein [Clostridia bacterium]|nr:zinc dependent phospholipase C family protein [Clostridia bacterium]
MPRHFTHYYFSQNLVEDASYAISAIVGLYPDAFLLGSLGADLFSEKAHKERLKDADPIQLFGVTAHHIFKNGSKCQLSYMLGFTAHFALERAADPFVSYFEKNGVNGYFGGANEKKSAKEIEIGIDRHIVRDYLGMKKALTLVDDFKVRKEVFEEVADLYVDVINDVADLYLNRRKTLLILESVKADIPLAEGLGRIDYMNRENREWVAYTGEKTALSFDELMKEQTPVAYELLVEYMKMARSNQQPNEALFALREEEKESEEAHPIEETPISGVEEN